MTKQTARLYTTDFPVGGRTFHVTDSNNILPSGEYVLLSGKKKFLTVPNKHLIGVEKVPAGEHIYKASIADQLVQLQRPGILESKVNMAEEVDIDQTFYLLLQQLSDEDGKRILRRYTIDRGFDNRKKLSFIQGTMEYLKKVEGFDDRLTTYGLGDKEVVDIARRRINKELKALGRAPRIEDYL